MAWRPHITAPASTLICLIFLVMPFTELNFSFETMTINDLESILGSITLLIIGLNLPILLEDKLRVALHKKNIGVEVMNTHSASHAFNVLLSESRQVGLLLL